MIQVKNSEGIYLIDKPTGWTSHDVVNVVRRWSGIKKVGHAGTLDPFASGLLIVLIGKDFTKRQSEFLKKDKEYEMTIILGKESTTFDPEGEISHVNEKKPTKETIKEVLKKFEGKISQRVPKFSAVKINGIPAYKKARKGEKFEAPEKTVKIFSLNINSYSYPELKLTAKVSSGTYIRSLAFDIGQRLGTGAYLKQLRRTKIGEFKLEDIENKLFDNIAGRQV